ncbi:hypothetical protein NXX09_00120 [Bacteroides uniformis]|nr:hypothetical protein [Bacteroides uniformis]
MNWDPEHLEKADLIIMNILASSKSPHHPAGDGTAHAFGQTARYL